MPLQSASDNLVLVRESLKPSLNSVCGDEDGRQGRRPGYVSRILDGGDGASDLHPQRLPEVVPPDT